MRNSRSSKKRITVRNINPHRIPNPSNRLPEVNSTPWQARRVKLATPSASGSTFAGAAIVAALPTNLQAAVSGIRLLRAYVYGRTQMKTGGPVTPETYIQSSATATFEDPTTDATDNFCTLKQQVDFGRTAVVAFDYGERIASSPLAPSSARPFMTGVTGTDVYVDCLIRFG